MFQIGKIVFCFDLLLPICIFCEIDWARSDAFDCVAAPLVALPDVIDFALPLWSALALPPLPDVVDALPLPSFDVEALPPVVEAVGVTVAAPPVPPRDWALPVQVDDAADRVAAVCDTGTVGVAGGAATPRCAGAVRGAVGRAAGSVAAVAGRRQRVPGRRGRRLRAAGSAGPTGGAAAVAGSSAGATGAAGVAVGVSAGTRGLDDAGVAGAACAALAACAACDGACCSTGA